MSIVDAIGRARAQHLTDHRRPARIWLVPEDYCRLISEIHASTMDPRSRVFMGMPFSECPPNDRSRVVAEDGTAIALEEASNKTG